MNDPRETNPPPDAPRPGPKEQEPSVYGGVWGGGAGGGSAAPGKGQPDSPEKATPPPEKN